MIGPMKVQILIFFHQESGQGSSSPPLISAPAAVEINFHIFQDE